MSEQAARFQAHSAFTSSGFTTRESESVVEHPVRRKVIMWLMLLGNAGIVAAAGSVIIGFRGSGSDALRVGELVVILLCFVVLSRSRWVDRRMTRTIAKVLSRWTTLPDRDVDSLIRLADGYSVSELLIEDDDWIAGRRLSATELRDEGTVVLGVLHPDGHYVGAPTGDTQLMPHDTLIVYGAAGALQELDGRRKGAMGDREHRLAKNRNLSHQDGGDRALEAERADVSSVSP